MVKKTILNNGVRIVTETVPGVHSVTIGIWIKVGARHEKKDEDGIAHFIEHMLFKGTKKYTAREIARLIDSVGGVLNAFTSKEYTCFYVKVLSQHLDLAVDLLSDIFFDSLFEQEEIEKERNVIIQEINMVKDTPDDYVQDVFNKAYFASHSLSCNILGDTETVNRFNKNELTDFFKRKYSAPEKIIISAAGNIEHFQLLNMFEKKFGRITGNGLMPENDSFVPKRNVSFHFRDLEQIHVCIGTAGLSQTDPDRHTLYILNTILGGSMSSRLFQEIRENHGLAYSVYSFSTSFYDTGMFGVYMGVVRESLNEALCILKNELNNMKDTMVDATELCNAKEQMKGNMLLAMESTDSRMTRLARCEIYYDRYIPVEELIQNIDGVTSGDIQNLALSLFSDEYFTYTFLGPAREEDLTSETLKLQ